MTMFLIVSCWKDCGKLGTAPLLRAIPNSSRCLSPRAFLFVTSFVCDLYGQNFSAQISDGRLPVQLEEDVVPFVLLWGEFQFATGQSAADCETRMRISTNTYTVTVLNWMRVDFPLWVANELLSQVEEFKSKWEQETNKLIQAMCAVVLMWNQR